jgi:hypothetical protein
MVMRYAGPFGHDKPVRVDAHDWLCGRNWPSPPAVVAMHGALPVSAAGVGVLAFFTELRKQGDVERAMAAMRGALASQGESWWRPVLYLRLRDGRLWARSAAPGAGAPPAPIISPEPRRPATVQDEPWAAGLEIGVAGTSYLLQDPVQVQAVPDRGFVNARALGRDARGRAVWLKQVRTLRATDSAGAAHAQLADEIGLWQRLGGRRGLPSLVAHERLPGVTTLVHTAVDGPTLADAFGLRGRKLVREEILVLAQCLASVCDSLAALHELGRSHRDLSSLTILVAGSGGRRASLCNLGDAARPARLRGPGQTGALEDVYQVGVLLYQAITGVHPELFATGPPPPDELNAACPPQLNAVMLRALAGDPADRWPTITALGGALRHCAAETRSS